MTVSGIRTQVPDTLAAPPSWARVGRGLARHQELLIGGGIFLCTLLVAGWNVANAPQFQDDEGTYASQAIAVQRGNLAHYTYWYDHPPLGWIQLALLAPLPQLVVGSPQLAAFRWVSVGLVAVTAVLVYLVAQRVNAARPFALAAVALYVLSPLTMLLGRQVFLDVVGTPWVLFAIYLALSPRRALGAHVGAGVAYAVAVWTKLTLAAFGPAILVAMFSRLRWRGRAFSLAGFLLTGGMLIMMYPIMALLRGELVSGPGHVSIQDAMVYQFASRSGSGSLWEPGSIRRGLLLEWLQNDRFLIIAGIIGAVVCLAWASTRWIPVALLGFALPIFGQGYLPAMYIVAALPIFALAIAVAGDRGWRAVSRLINRDTAAYRHAVPRYGPKIFQLVAVALLLVLVAAPASDRLARGRWLMESDVNADWRATLSWVDKNLSREDTVLVPYSLLVDTQALGWKGTWSVIALEKVDLDSEFAQAHPGGWRDIDWVIEGPTVARNIRALGLPTAAAAYQNSEVVATYGEWRIRKVLPDRSDPSSRSIPGRNGDPARVGTG